MKAWIDGRVVSDARISAADRGFTLADGAFATVLCRNARPLFWAEHMSRFRAALSLLEIDCPFRDEELFAAAAELLGGDGAAVVRVTASRGAGARGLAPPPGATATVVVSAHPLPPAPTGPVSAVVVSVARNERSPSSRHKTAAYTDNILAALEARRLGADEAIMPNGAGRLACASAANLFVLRRGVAATPPPSEGCRPGVAREILMRAAADAGSSVRERPVERAELDGALVFATNAARGPFRLDVQGAAAPAAEDVDAFGSVAAAYARALDREAR